jgi:lysyl-tRNA synthetase class 2
MSQAPQAPAAAPVVATDDNQLIAERREKLAAIREQARAAGSAAFPNDFKPRDHAADLHRAHEGKTAEELEAHPITACVGGRMMLKRVMGKACFATLQDGSSSGNPRIQLYVTQDAVGAETLAAFKRWDLGDILGAEGTLFRTKTGELSIKVSSIRLLTDRKSTRLNSSHRYISRMPSSA